MQAVILVGGEGTRLRPLTFVTPKPMVPLFGVPFLERTLSRLRHAGVRHAILAAGYLPNAIVDYFGDGSRLSMKIDYRVETSPLGTAGALKNVADLIEGTFFVLNGDVLTSLDLEAMIALHRERAGAGVLHSIRVDDPSAFGCIVADERGRVERFVEKPPRDQAPTDVVNAGTYLLEPSVLDAIPPATKVSIERETFPQLLAAGTPLYTFCTGDYWLDIGRPEQYLQAHADVLDARCALRPSADPDHHGGAMWPKGSPSVPRGIIAPSFVGENVAIGAGAIVGPYAVIGDGCTIGEGAIVQQSILWDDVIVGPGARIDGSILASRVAVGANATIEAGSVLGHATVVASEVPATAPARAR